MKKLTILISLLIACTNLFSQDIIELKSGNKIEAKLIEITESTIKYKKYNNLEGPTYTISLSEISSITYENGTKDIFDNTTLKKSDIATSIENIGDKISNEIDYSGHNIAKQMNRTIGLEIDKLERKAMRISVCGIIFGMLPGIGMIASGIITQQWWMIPTGAIAGAFVSGMCIWRANVINADVQNYRLEEYQTLNFGINKNTTISTCYFASKQQLIPQKAFGLGVTVNF